MGLASTNRVPLSGIQKLRRRPGATLAGLVGPSRISGRLSHELGGGDARGRRTGPRPVLYDLAQAGRQAHRMGRDRDLQETERRRVRKAALLLRERDEG